MGVAFQAVPIPIVMIRSDSLPFLSLAMALNV